MTEFSSSARLQLQVRPMQSAFASTVALQQNPAIAERDGLANYFAAPLGYAWRANFVEPSLDDVTGLGPALLTFDF